MKWFINMNNRAQTNTMRTLEKEKKNVKTEIRGFIKTEKQAHTGA
jgi:hypothetical protein